MIDGTLKRQLERDEGRELKAYRDTNGYWTIGVGHLLGSSPRMSDITNAECDALLAYDIETAVDSVSRVFGPAVTRIDAPRVRALVNMMFNRGEDRVRKSTTITPAIKAAIEADIDHDHAWNKVSAAILASEWGAQIKDRAKRLAKQFETGVDA